VRALGERARCPNCNRQLRLPARPEDLPVNKTLESAMARLLRHNLQVRGEEVSHGSGHHARVGVLAKALVKYWGRPSGQRSICLAGLGLAQVESAADEVALMGAGATPGDIRRVCQNLADFPESPEVIRSVACLSVCLSPDVSPAMVRAKLLVWIESGALTARHEEIVIAVRCLSTPLGCGEGSEVRQVREAPLT
jgi:hypothetical protein